MFFFLYQTPDLSHSVIAPTSFRVEYRRSGGTSMFSRNVKFQVDIAQAHGEGSEGHKVHCVNFTLIAGPSRRFKRICELMQSMLLSNRGQQPVSQRRISADLCSDSSSSSYSSMDRVSPTPPDDVVSGSAGVYSPGQVYSIASSPVISSRMSNIFNTPSFGSFFIWDRFPFSRLVRFQ